MEAKGRIILVWCQKLPSALPSPSHPWPLVPLVPLLSGASTCFRLVAYLRFPDCFFLDKSFNVVNDIDVPTIACGSEKKPLLVYNNSLENMLHKNVGSIRIC